MKRLLIATAFSLLWTSSAYAQTCLGNMTFESQPLRVGANVAFSSDTHTFGGGVTRGLNNNLFALGGLQYQGISDFGEGGNIIGFVGAVGKEFPLGADQKFFLCPTGSFFFLSGPEVFVDNKASTVMFNFGGNVGFEAATSGTTRIVPTFGFHFNIARQSFSSEGFGDFTDSETFATLNAGVGLIFNDRMALVPSLVIPFVEDTELTFNVIFTIKVGK